MTNRLNRLREKIAEQKLDGLIVSGVLNQKYVAGFAGHADFDSVLLISAESASVVTDSRYTEKAGQTAHGFAVIKRTPEYEYPQAIAEWAKANSVRTLGFEAHHLTFDRLQAWQKAARKVPTKLKPALNLVGELRAVKDEQELKAIRHAVQLTDKAFAFIAARARPGMTERQAAWMIELFLREHGGERLAFDLIVASGPNSALPHAEVTDRAFQTGEPITFDMGVRLDGYNSDLTRTITLGEMTDKFKEVYNTVLKAQRNVEKKARAGMNGKRVDALSRRVIEKAGYGENFGHGLGHGVGLAVHELPSARKNSKDVLEPNMTLTVEPGIYIPGWGGVRIEDLVVIQKDGVEVLSQASKEPLIKLDRVEAA